MFQNHLTKFTLALALGLAASATGFADLDYTGTPAGTPATAGSGPWDNTTTLNWSSNGTTADSHWADGNGKAVFEGVGGTVTSSETLNIDTATFTGAGSYTFNNSGIMNMTGAGIVNNGSGTQTFGGTGSLNLQGASTVTGAVTLDNGGSLTFAGTSNGGSAAIINEAGAFTDISALDSAGITATSLENAGDFTMGDSVNAKTLGVTTLTLDSGDEFDMTLGSTSSQINANSVAATGVTDLEITEGPGFGDPSYTLITDATGVLSLSNYVVGANYGGTAPGYELELADGGHDLDLVAVPEVSSFMVPLIGAAGLVMLRRRRSGLALEALPA